MKELDAAQHAAAKLLAVNPDMSKAEVAQIVGVSRSTLYKWLAIERFELQIEEYRITPTVMTDPDTLMETLTVEEREQVRQILSKQERGLSLADEIDQEIDMLGKRIDAITDTKRRENDLQEIDKLIGRLKIALQDRDANHYNSDGSPKPVTLQMYIELAEDYQELLILCKSLDIGDDPEEWELNDRWIRALKAAQQIRWPRKLPEALLTESQ